MSPYLKRMQTIVLGMLLWLAGSVEAARLHSGVSTLDVQTEVISPPTYDTPPDIEYRIDDLDVYKLSRHARVLRMSHSVTVQMLSSLKSPKDSAQSWLKEARKAADASGLPLNLILAVIDTESGAVAQAVSEKGAQGLMQLMPATQLDLGVANPFDPEENIMAGSRYLAWLYQRFNDLELALAAYNAGPGNVAKYGGIPPFAETQNFVRRVIDRYKSLDSRSN